MNQSAWIKPEWNPATIALMVIGFMIFWPLGLAMLAYILFGDRLHEFKRDANTAFDSTFKRQWGRADTAPSENAAFAEWREKELERIEAERRKLNEMQAEFDQYLRELHRARDKQEFESFMRDRKAGYDTSSQA